MDVVYNGRDALEYAENGGYDGVILDWMMPELSGVQVLEQLRARQIATPCLMLTARDAVEDRVRGLDAGADDYLAKPFAMKELVARLRSLIRRNSDYRYSVLKYANIELDSNSCELKSDKGSLRLNNTEAELLAFLIRNDETYFTAEDINTQLWGGKESPEKAELYVFYLKNKLRQIHADGNILMRGDAYALGEG